MHVRPDRREALETVLRAAKFNIDTGWTWNDEWKEPQPEWYAAWQESGHFPLAEDQLRAFSDTYRQICECGELEDEWGEDDRYPRDLGHLKIDAAGSISCEEWGGHPNQSDLLAHVLTDFVEPGGIVECWTSGSEPWAYEIMKPGEIRGLTLAWVTTRGSEIVTEFS
jgi:hypothetical protein